VDSPWMPTLVASRARTSPKASRYMAETTAATVAKEIDHEGTMPTTPGR
jgi:hypothetical protein